MTNAKAKRGLRLCLIFATLICFALSSVSAAINSERIYPVGSDEYRYISWLSLLNGIAMPSSSGPWSGSELLSMLERIDCEDLDEVGRELYDRVSDTLRKDAEGNGNVISFEFGVNVNADASVHTNPNTFIHPDDYGNWNRIGDFNRPRPLVEFPFSFAAGDNIFGYTEIPLGMNRSLLNHTHYLPKEEAVRLASTEETVAQELFGEEVTYDPITFRHNIYLLPPSGYMDIDLTFPWRSYLTIGGDWWNLTVGKDKLSVGPGVSGNLLVGDHIPFHNNARLSFFSDRLKYTFSLSSFMHPDNYIYKGPDGREYVDLGFNENDERKSGSSFFMFHRFESRWDKVSFALSEAVMYQSDAGADLSLISPMSVFHNLYMRHNANSLLSLEFEYDFGNIDWYNVVLVDDMNFPGEFAGAEEPPMAMGFQTGLKGAWSVGNGILHSSIEAVMTTPFLYLRDDGSRKGDNWGINFIVDFPEFNFNPDQKIESYMHELQFLGYRYGNDAVTADFQIGWESLGGLKFDFDFFYMAHGVRDKYTRWAELKREDMPGTLVGHRVPNDSYLKYDNENPKDAVSHTIDLTFQTEVPLGEYGIRFLTKSDFVTVVNYQNRRSGGTVFDFQFMLGFRYSY